MADWQHVEKSSSLKRVRYADGILDVEFHRGAAYRYAGVTPDAFEAFMAAESKGQYFQQHIRPIGGERVPERNTGEQEER